ncbi:uncharacterized protein LOC108027179 isoform X2 [Drosophila biarmipes]|nr:uncharacterized protein LOC108027179 isoform X2 [Drosophila biarmipes]
MSQMGFLSMLPKMSSLVIKGHPRTSFTEPTSLATFLQSIVQKGQFSLTSCKIKDVLCSVSDCSSIYFLSQLTNLQNLEMSFNESFDSQSSSLVLNLLQGTQMTAKLDFKNVCLIILKGEQKLDIFIRFGCRADVLSPLAQLNGVTTVRINGYPDKKTRNMLFEAFATSNISTIQELDISKMSESYFYMISKVAEIQSIKKLSCDLVDFTGVEKLANLDKLEELIIKSNEFGTLSSLFTSLAARNIIQCIRIPKGKLSPEEILKASGIKSLKIFECSFADLQDQESLSELAKSSVEELIVSLEYSYKYRNPSVVNLLSAFSSNGAKRLQRLEIKERALDICEANAISKLPALVSLQIASPDSLRIFANNPLCKLQKLELSFQIGHSECELMVQFETLPSLKCPFRDEKGVEALANIKGLKELIIVKAAGSLGELYRAFAQKSLTILEKLHTPTVSSDEVRWIAQIRSLTELSIECKCVCDNLSYLCKLSELKSLSIAENDKSTLTSDNVLPIIQDCRKLDFVTLDFYNDYSKALKISREVNTILKSVRDPAHRRPLKLCIKSFKLNGEVIDNEYLQVSHSRKIEKHYLVRRSCFGGCRRSSSSWFSEGSWHL